MSKSSINTAIDGAAHFLAGAYADYKYPQGYKNIEQTRKIVEFNIKTWAFNVSTVLLVAAAAKLFFLSIIPAIIFGGVGYVLREVMLSNLKQYEKEPPKTLGEKFRNLVDGSSSDDEEDDFGVDIIQNILCNLGVKDQPRWAPDYYVSDHIVWKKPLPISPASPRKGTDLIDEVGALFKKASNAVSKLLK